MQKTNTLIVGQGIAGCLVAYLLHQQGIPFKVMDPGLPGTASRVAAGMFSPISGKRKTVQPAVLEEIADAVQQYRSIEKLLGTDLLHLSDIYQVYGSAEEQRDLMAKAQDPFFSSLIDINPATETNLQQQHGAVGIRHAGWVDCEAMINAFSNWLMRSERLVHSVFMYDQLTFTGASMQYSELEFEHTVFCEGYEGKDNPFFQQTIIPCKGDVLTIRCGYPAGDRILKRNSIYLVPAAGGTFRTGTTYHWNNDSLQPQAADQQQIEAQLNTLLATSYTTTGHRCAIRPTTPNREAIGLQHPQHRGMFFLNGLGTKGVIQGPRWARYIVELLLRSR